MSINAFIGEINIFAFDFAPTAYYRCEGQLLSIQQNTALFSLIGTFYGGNGSSNFALPNLQGRIAVGTDNNLGTYPGEDTGASSATLSTLNIPVHQHLMQTSKVAGNAGSPNNALLALPLASDPDYKATGTLVPMHAQSIAPHGGSMPINLMQPFLTLNFCICKQGVFPSRW